MHNTKRWLQPLGAICRKHNQRICSSTKESPYNILHDPAANHRAFVHLHSKELERSTSPSPVKKKKKPSIDAPKIGDHVRISVKRSRLEKGSSRNSWSFELFRIAHVNDTDAEHTLYGLVELGGSPIQGLFYRPEIQVVTKDVSALHTLKILKEKQKNGITYVQYIFVNDPHGVAKWAPKSSITSV